MRLIFYAPRYHTNQINIAEALQSTGNDIKYLVLNKGVSEDYTCTTPVVVKMSLLWMIFEKLFPCVFGQPMKKMKWGMPSFFFLLFEVLRFKPDRIIFRGDPLRTVPNICLWCICLLCKIRVIIYSQDPIHGRPSSAGRRFSYWLYLNVFKYSWYTPVLGNPEKFQPRRGMTYLPFVAEPKISQSLAGKHGDDLHILTVGKMVPRKNHRLLIAALKEITKERKFHLTIVGECSTAQHENELLLLKKLIHHFGMESQVAIKLNLSIQALCALYRKADLFVLPSTNEPASVSHLEAMAHGLPVICSNTNGTSCYITNGYDGFLFTDNDKNDLTVCLRRILISNDDLNKFGNNAISTAKSNHSAEKFLKVFMSL